MVDIKFEVVGNLDLIAEELADEDADIVRVHVLGDVVDEDLHAGFRASLWEVVFWVAAGFVEVELLLECARADDEVV